MHSPIEATPFSAICNSSSDLAAVAFCHLQRHSWQAGFFPPRRFPTAGGMRSVRQSVVCRRGNGLASIWRYLLAGFGLTALLVGVLAVVYLTASQSSQPAGPDGSRRMNTDNGLFVVRFLP